MELFFALMLITAFLLSISSIKRTSRTFVVFETVSAPSLMTDNSIRAFEKVSFQYFSEVFESRYPESSTSLESTVLASQNMMLELQTA